MFQRLEKLFREMNRAQSLDIVLRTALLGLEGMIDGCRARVVPESYELTHRISSSKLEAHFILLQSDKHEVLRRAVEHGQVIVSAEGVDPQRIHCCVIPFAGGLLYLDRSEPFEDEVASLAGTICHQLAANISAMNFGMTQVRRDALKGLPDESWLRNELHQYGAFSILFLEFDSFQELSDQRGSEVAQSAQRELVAFVQQRMGEKDILARSYGGAFILLTPESCKSEFQEFWRNAFREFRGIGIAKLYNLTISAGLAEFPQDGSRYSVKDLAQTACARARKLGDRVIAVATQARCDSTSEEDPMSRFKPSAKAAVKLAIQECQVRQRGVDCKALVWGVIQQGDELSSLFSRCGLDKSLFRKTLVEGTKNQVEFEESARLAFGLALEFALRSGRSAVGEETLVLACLSDFEVEKALQECGLKFGKLMIFLYREGFFASEESLLVGDLRYRVKPTYEMRSLPKSQSRRLLNQAFGDNFAAETWATLAEARKEAQNSHQDLDFPHLYIATLGTDSPLLPIARGVLKSIRSDRVLPEFCRTKEAVVLFFQELDEKFEEVTVDLLREFLLKRSEIDLFVALMDKRRESGLED